MAAEFTATTSTAGGGNFRVQHRPPCRPRLAAPAAAFTPGCWAVRRRHYPPEQRRRVPGAAARQEPSAASTAEAAKPSKQEDQQGAAHPPAQPPPSRLQQEVQLLVALDVEYAHLRLAPAWRHVSLPAEVCAVDAEGRVLLYEQCNPLGEHGDAVPGLWRLQSGPTCWPAVSRVPARLPVAAAACPLPLHDHLLSRTLPFCTTAFVMLKSSS